MKAFLPPRPANPARRSERGNVFFIILIGIALFAALAFTLSRGTQSQSTGKLSAHQAKIIAQEMMDYGQRVQRGVQRLLSRGCSENDISFEGAPAQNGAAYIHTPVASDSCKVFHPDGGGLTPLDFSQDGRLITLQGLTWPYRYPFFIANGIAGVGEEARSEMLLVQVFKNIQVCIEINNLAGIANPGDVPPRDTTQPLGGTDFRGTFPDTTATNQYHTTSGDEIEGKTAGCYVSNQTNGPEDSYYFYYVLLAR